MGLFYCILPTVIDCGPLENPENGAVMIDSGDDAVITTGHRAVATYTCNFGYRLDSGSRIRTCGTSGTWSGTMAVCVCKYCTCGGCTLAALVYTCGSELVPD